MPQTHTQAAANAWHQEEAKWTEITICEISKQMHEKHIDQLSLSSQTEAVTMLTGLKIHENKEQGNLTWNAPL